MPLGTHPTCNPTKPVCRVCAVRTHAVFLNHSLFQPNQRSSETHFQTTFCHFIKQRFPHISQTSSESVNFPYFKNFLEANHAPPISAPHYRTQSTLFLAGHGAVRKTSAGHYRAEVCGSENYWVWLKLDSDLYIKDGGCDCPYV